MEIRVGDLFLTHPHSAPVVVLNVLPGHCYGAKMRVLLLGPEGRVFDVTLATVMDWTRVAEAEAEE